MPNAAPIDIILTFSNVDEQAADDTLIGELFTIDSDVDDPTRFTLLDDSNGRFRIDGNQLVVADGAALVFADTNQHTIEVEAIDSGDNTCLLYTSDAADES